MRCAYRNQNSPEIRNNKLGFRLVRIHDWPGWAVLNRSVSSLGAVTAVGDNELVAGALVEVSGMRTSEHAAGAQESCEFVGIV